MKFHERTVRSRRGIGTVTGLVLTIVGIVLLIVLGVDVINRGSRWTMEKAFAASRAIDIGGQAIDEVCLSPALKAKVMEELTNSIKASYPAIGASANTEDAMNFLLPVISNAKPSGGSGPLELQNPFQDPTRQADYQTIDTGAGESIRLCPTGLPNLNFLEGRRPNTVAFGSGTPLKIVPTLTKASFADDPGLVNKDLLVEMRVVLYSLDSVYDPASNGQIGNGVARARCQVVYRIGKQTITRWVTQDRMFQFDHNTATSTWTFVSNPLPSQVEARESLN